ncbi:hypothetical protein ACQ0QQ_15760 [Lysinibacillus sphaericus]
MDIGTTELMEIIANLTYKNSSSELYTLLLDKLQDCRFKFVEGALHNEAAWGERVPQHI